MPLLLISKSFSLYFKFLETVPSTQSTSDITVTLMFHTFHRFLATSKSLSIFRFSFIFLLWSTEKANIIIIIILSTYTSISWWTFTGVWLTASVPKSPELFSVYRLILMKLLFGWFPLVLLFPYPTHSVSVLWWPSQEHQLQLVSQSPSRSIVFQFSSKVQVLILLFAFFQSYSTVSLDSKVNSLASSLFSFLTIIRSCGLGEIRWSVCISKSQRSLCVSFSRTDSGLCIYHLFEWPNFRFLHNSKWIALPIQLCQVLSYLPNPSARAGYDTRLIFLSRV